MEGVNHEDIFMYLKCALSLSSVPTVATYPPPCPPGSFRCGLGFCIESSKICDGVSDCHDNSDEAECGECNDHDAHN